MCNAKMTSAELFIMFSQILDERPPHIICKFYSFQQVALQFCFANKKQVTRLMFEVNECRLIDTCNIYNQKRRQYGCLKKLKQV